MPLIFEGGYVETHVIVNKFTEALRDLEPIADREVLDYVEVLKLKILKHAKETKPHDSTRHSNGDGGKPPEPPIYEAKQRSDPEPEDRDSYRTEFERRKAKSKRQPLGEPSSEVL